MNEEALDMAADIAGNTAQSTLFARTLHSIDVDQGYLVWGASNGNASALCQGFAVLAICDFGMWVDAWVCCVRQSCLP